MITEYDERVYVESKHLNEFKECLKPAFDNLKDNARTFVEYNWGTDRVMVQHTVKAFDDFIQHYGFELDARTLRHPHGIGNNNYYDVVDEELVKVGDFFCNDNMFGGVITGVSIKNETIIRLKLGVNRSFYEILEGKKL